MNIRLQTLFETPAKVRMTARQYLDDPRSEQKSDLIEGVFVMASPASFGHESVVSFIFGTLLNFVESKGIGRVLGLNEVKFSHKPLGGIGLRKPGYFRLKTVSGHLFSR